jgi:beta-xylosidase
LAATKEGGETHLVMAAFRDGEEQEVERIRLDQDVIHLKVHADFRDQADRAVFSYSVDGEDWKPIGDTLQMRYTLVHFMGARFALFSYGTTTAGGTADFAYFRIGPD